jgi:hypothetical protein
LYCKILDEESWLLLSRSLFYVELVRLVIGCAFVIDMPVLIIERTLATVKLKTYEKEKNNVFTIASVGTQYSGGVLAAYIIYNGKVYFLKVYYLF